MALVKPASTDKLSDKDHALMHRQVTSDDSASEEALAIDSNDKAKFKGAVEVSSSNPYYLGDPDTNGSWRINRSGNDLVFQRRESGSWVTKSWVLASA